MPHNRKPVHILLTAGEASGDLLGARLMRALKRQSPERDIRFSGVGGPLMAGEGLASLFPMSELSVMGIMEVLPKLKSILRRIDETARFIQAQKPDAVVTIDSPDFSFRVAKRAQRMAGRKPLWIHYVAPSVWAWRPERAAKVAGLYDGLLCLFPFEPPYFTQEGMSAAFTGHPAIENIRGLEAGSAFREQHGIPADAFVLGTLFGSRRGEVKRMGNILRATIEGALDRVLDQDIHIVAPTFPYLESQVKEWLKDLPCTIHSVTDAGQKWQAFASMDAALAVSGTVGLELAVSSVPHVIAYRMNKLTHSILRRKVKVRYAHLANILLDDAVVPEFIQDDARPDLILDKLVPLFNQDGAASTSQRTAFLNLRQRISGEGEGTPSEQAAHYVMKFITR